MNENSLRPIKQRYGIIGDSQGLNRALDIAIQVAPTDLSVLIQGESGVGKEVIPRVIHDNSIRKHKKYFAINCGSIPEGTIDSELFGHEKGAFTGSIGEREGYFGTADKGTLFLDEVGELPLSTQARLLRVLETGEYIRVGSSEVRKTDVRIIAATNVNLQKAISEGKFREDLYYRLATIPIAVPPLRERGRDIEILFRKFASDFAEKYMLAPIELTDDAKKLLLSYKWPGNIRQLKNIAEQICIISKERKITAEELIQFGITDDSNSGVGLVIAKPMMQSGPNSYENEREMILKMLTELGKEMKDIKNKFEHMQAQNITPIYATPYSSQEPAKDNMYIEYTDNHADPVMIHIPQTAVHPQMPQVIETKQDDLIYEETPLTMKEREKKQIAESLRRNNYRRCKTAKELKISERTLYRKIKEYGLDKK